MSNKTTFGRIILRLRGSFYTMLAQGSLLQFGNVGQQSFFLWEFAIKRNTFLETTCKLILIFNSFLQVFRGHQSSFICHLAPEFVF